MGTDTQYTTPIGPAPSRELEHGTAIVPVGAFIRPDGWRGLGARLDRGDEPHPTWAGSQYRIPISRSGPVRDFPVNIEITGRSVTYRDGMAMMRCRVEWVRDGEPSDFDGAWVEVHIL